MSLSIFGLSYLIIGLLLSGVSSSITSLNFIVTILNIRCYGIILIIMNIYGWSVIITAFMLLLVLPILLGSLIMLLLDLYFNSVIFDYSYGGDPIFYQHLFWFFGHPEVYILIIPGLGLINIIISDLVIIIVFGYS